MEKRATLHVNVPAAAAAAVEEEVLAADVGEVVEVADAAREEVAIATIDLATFSKQPGNHSHLQSSQNRVKMNKGISCALFFSCPFLFFTTEMFLFFVQFC